MDYVTLAMVCVVMMLVSAFGWSYKMAVFTTWCVIRQSREKVRVCTVFTHFVGFVIIAFPVYTSLCLCGTSCDVVRRRATSLHSPCV